VSGLAPLLRPGAVVVFGELHGTRESPALVGDALCAAVRAGLPATLALELPVDEQGAIDRYLASAGRRADRAALSAGAFWDREYPDGRSSVAMLGLLERARSLRRAAPGLRVVAFAPPSSLPFPRHDGAMADVVGAAARDAAGGVLVVLTGNVHARLSRGTPFDSAFTPMAHLLAAALGGGRVTSLDMAHDGGRAWTCHPAADDPDRFVCDASPFDAKAGAAAWQVTVGAADADAPYSGHYGVGPITASPPAHRPPATRR
jgi:hypothetical protein